MKTESVLIDSLRPDPRNARRHDGRNLEAIAKSLETFGQQKPIVVGKDGRVVAGNGTLEAARKLGWEQIEIVRTNLTAAQARAYAIADNRTAELAYWDDAGLADLLRELEADESLDVLSTGFSPDEIRELIDGVAEPEVTQDEVPEPPKDPVTKLGDVWELGRHRLVCGDSTDGAVVALASNAAKAQLCLTDPPYGVAYERSQSQRGGSKTAHAPYREGEATAVLAFMGLVPADVMVWTYPLDRHLQEVANAYVKHGWELRRELVWVKDVFSFWPGASYQQQHEPIMVAARRGKPVGGAVPANASTVIQCKRPRAHSDHPTAKPIELWAMLLANHAPEHSAVYDPFAGSGTTLIACEQLERICHAVEIEPAYCDVVIERWQNLTGGKAKRRKGAAPSGSLSAFRSEQ